MTAADRVLAGPLVQAQRRRAVAAALLHLRPQAFVPTYLMALSGYALSPLKGARGMVLELVVLFVVHSVLLWGGTNAFNTGEDGDDGPLSLLAHPPASPPWLSTFGLVVKGAAVVLACWWSATTGLLVAVAAMWSYAYSQRRHRWRRLKDIPGADLATNALGCGLGSVLLGYVITGAPLSFNVVVVGLGFSAAMAGGTPTAQIFQLAKHDDITTQPNWCTLVGPARVLRLTPLWFGVHVLLLEWASPVLSSVSSTTSALGVALTLGWMAPMVAAALHALWWARAPYVNGLPRMTRQLAMMMLSQLCWTALVWLQYDGGVRSFSLSLV